MKTKPLKLNLCRGVTDAFTTGLASFCMWSRRGEVKGAGREAFLTEDTFPFEMTYTVQKSGAAFDTLLPMLDVLNLVQKSQIPIIRFRANSRWEFTFFHDDRGKPKTHVLGMENTQPEMNR